MKRSATPWLIALGALLAGLFYAGVASAGVKEATVRIGNGDKGGSGVIIAFDRAGDVAYGLSCAHLFQGKIDGNFEVIAFDGTKLKATLKEHDPVHDVSLFVVPQYEKLDTLGIAEKATEKAAMAGYPKIGDRQVYREISVGIDPKNDWETGPDVDHTAKATRYFGDLGEGSSGGPIATTDGGLLGIISCGDRQGTFSCTHEFLQEFCARPRQLCCNGRCRGYRLFKRKIVMRQGPVVTKTIERSPQPVPPVDDSGSAPVPPPFDGPPAPSPAPSGDEPEPAPVPQPAPPGIGQRGPAGPQGPRGEKGDDGPEGKQGPPGATGLQGPPGKDADPKAIAALQQQIAELTKQLTALQTELAGLVASSGTRGQSGEAQPGVDPAAFQQLQADVANLKKFQKNLTGNKITVPVVIPQGVTK